MGVAGQGRNQRTEAVAAQLQDRPFRRRSFLVELQPADDRNVGAGKVDEALGVTRVEVPLHADGLGDVTGDFDDGGMDQHLGPWLVQLTHDVFDGPHLRGFGDQHQRVLAFVGLDHEGCTASRVLGAADGGSLLSALPHRLQNLGQLLGIAVTQANHPGIVEGRGGRRIETSGQLDQALADDRRTNENQAIGPGVGQHLYG
ncbi:hypothetical protein D9M69_478980 [compost metagenome]